MISSLRAFNSSFDKTGSLSSKEFVSVQPMNLPSGLVFFLDFQYGQDKVAPIGNFGPAGDTWDCVRQWEIVNYRYKDQPDVSDLNIGVIAQQVAESCPEVITVFEEAKDDQPERLGVKEQQMYWMAIKALQEAQVRIEQLEQRLTDAGIA